MAKPPLSMHFYDPGVELLKLEIESRQKKQKVKVDTSNIFVCVYNDDKVDLFSRQKYSTTTSYSNGLSFNSSGFIYKGLNFKDIAIYEQTNSFGSSECWKETGYTLCQDVVNCQLNKIVSFDEMIKLMDVNSAMWENSDIIKENMSYILDFASDYYKLGNKKAGKHFKVKVKKLPGQEG